MSSEKIIVLLSAEKNNSPLERWKQTILPLSAEKKNNSLFERWKKFLLLGAEKSLSSLEL